MSMRAYDDERIISILKQSKTIAVVGISQDPGRPSFRVASFLKEKGYKIFPVNPGYPEILGEKSYHNLLEIPFDIDIVDIFRKPEAVLPIVEEGITKKAKVIWMQEGIVNEDAALLGEKNNIEVVMNRCMMKEYIRLINE